MHKRSIFPLPHVGLRIIKTSIAVFFCLIIYRLFGFQGETMPTEAAVTAIVCMQPFIIDTETFAINRLIGTLIGTVWGLVFLVVMYNIPLFYENYIIIFGMMSLGVLLSIYSAVVLRAPDVSGFSAIVFIAIVANFPDIEAPHIEVAKRFMGVFIGMLVALFVNLAHLPRAKRSDRLFFIRSKDISPSRYGNVSPSVLFYLKNLHDKGARICITSEHAPAMFTMEMSNCQLNLPLIVMDGAAIFDTKENRYIYVEHIDTKGSQWIQDWFQENHISFFIYTIKNNRTCIFHNGTLNEMELAFLKELQRSPYRNYLNEDDFNLEEIVYFKVIGKKDELDGVLSELSPILSSHKLRAAIRDQGKIGDEYGLYIFSEMASIENAKKKLMEILSIIDPTLHPIDMQTSKETYSEQNAINLLHRLRNMYEPVLLRNPLHKKSGEKT